MSEDFPVKNPYVFKFTYLLINHFISLILFPLRSGIGSRGNYHAVFQWLKITANSVFSGLAAHHPPEVLLACSCETGQGAILRADITLTIQ